MSARRADVAHRWSSVWALGCLCAKLQSEDGVFESLVWFTSRNLGTPSGGGKDLQDLELGDGVQTLVSRSEDPPVSGQPTGTQGQENGS